MDRQNVFNQKDDQALAFGERLNKAVAWRGIKDYGKYSELASWFGITPAAVKKWFTGSFPAQKRIKVLAERLNVNSQWLMTGEGPMLETTAVGPTGEEMRLEVRMVPILAPHEIEDWQNGTLPVSGYQRVTVTGRVSEKTFAYVISDDSLFPTATRDTVVVVDPLHPDIEEPAQSSLPVVALVGGSFIAGKYVRRGAPTILPENKDYRPVEMTPSDRVIGIIIKLAQRDLNI